MVKETSSLKEFEKNVITGDELNITDKTFFRICPALDIALCGGLISGQWVELSGKAKVGKTSLALTYADDVIKRGGTVNIFDIEHRLDPRLLDVIGLDKSKVKIIRSTIDRVMSGDDILRYLGEILKDQKNTFNIIDSVPAMVFEDELTSESVGIPSKKLTKFFREFNAALNINNHTVVWLNHEKTAINFRNKSGIQQTYTPGGDYIQFLCS